MVDLPAGNVAFNNYVMNIKDITFATLKTDLQFAFLTCQLVSQEVIIIIVWSYWRDWG